MENDYMNDALLGKISREQNVKISQIRAVLQLIEGGATVPFIARYRKEVTGGLDENQIRAIYQEWDYGQKLAQKKDDYMRLIEEKGKLTDEIKQSIINATKLSELEDIYRPFKEKKKTRATDAKKKGLEPLAQYLLSYPMEGSVEEEAKKYVTDLTGKTTEEIDAMKKEGLIVKDEKEAIQGAKDIIAEMVSDEPRYRAWIREFFEKNSKIKCTLQKDAVDEKKVYEMYYDYEEPIVSIKIHRILAINRAEDEKVIKVDLVEDYAQVQNYINTDFIKVADSIATPYIREACEDAYERLIRQSIIREIRSDLKDKAEDQAILIFGENLRNYLLQPPMKGKIVLGVDPAFRTGCKLAVVDATGKLLEKSVMYPHEKSKGEVVPPARYQAAVETFKELVIKHNVEVVAMGNGTASRETEAFVASTLAGMKEELDKLGREVKYIIVNEAGASVYSASAIAQEEYPDFSVEERSAISIARRLQDPLAELVKIDPKSIGVGQYQHDVTQSKLEDSLDFVVSTAVNQVGVNINTASQSLLKYVAGLNAGTAKKIYAHRDENGRFENREDIKKVKGLGPKAFEQAIGFLRIVDGNEPLDMTGIHPESYEAARGILAKLESTTADLGKAELVEKVKALTPEEIKGLETELNVGEYTIKDILDAFVSPLRDPRDMIEAPVLKSDVLHLEDLQVGMELQGTVRNVTDFGAFVDCGLHDDGLVHISKMSSGYIKHPLDVVHVGQIIQVWVLEVDLIKGRLQLTMIDPNAPKVEPQRKEPKPKQTQEHKEHKKPNNNHGHKPNNEGGQKPSKPGKKKPQQRREIELPFTKQNNIHLGRK